ncbi:MAG TPA: DegQ family serine endoprotease [Rhizomicrobium sp.]|jgi:serine protease Do|nr:DegQ family serine endoprotease [Rhizomicrobium sp.]
MNDVKVLIQRHKRLLAAGAAAGIVLFGLGAFALVPHSGQVQKLDAVTATGEQPIQMASLDDSKAPRLLENGAPFSFADLVERVSPAVVTINVEEEVKSPDASQLQGLPPQFRQFFGDPNGGGGQAQPRRATSVGSGFIVSKDGLVVTNNHVVDGAKKITVKLPDGRSFEGKLLGTDPLTDVALVKINSPKPLPSVEFGDDHQLRVGDWVVAVGNPFGLSNTVTAGIVSSIGRAIGNGPYTDFIQIDAPINRGNSGGPTFDLRGQVIGMNSMIFSPSGGSVGIGFAIPASIIHDVVNQLITKGHVTRGWLGVQIQSITPEIASSLGMDDPKGAIVANVVPGSPAAKAGLVQGDIVVALNNKQIEDSRDLTRRVASLPVDSKATFTVNRQGSVKTLTATITARGEDKVASNDAGPSKGAEIEPRQASVMGLGLSALTPDVRRTFNVDDGASGVLITKVDPNSDAAQNGVQPGDILVSVSRAPVRTPADVQAQVNAAKTAGRKSVLLLVNGQGGQLYFTSDLDQT